MGESTFMVSVSRQIAEYGKYGVGIMSLEMDKVSIGSRIATDRAYDPRDRIAYSSVIREDLSLRRQEIITNAGFDRSHCVRYRRERGVCAKT
jgi:replicative DNA helicase